MKTIISALFALALGGCAMFGGPAPETTVERMASLEIGYQEVLKTATAWRVEGRLDDDQVARLTELFDEYERARDAAKALLDVGDAVQAENRVVAMSGALQALRDILASLETSRGQGRTVVYA